MNIKMEITNKAKNHTLNFSIGSSQDVILIDGEEYLYEEVTLALRTISEQGHIAQVYMLKERVKESMDAAKET